MKTNQLNHVALHVEDLDASVVFYRDVLDLEPIARPAFSFDGAWFRIGVDQELHLIAERDKAVNSHHRGNHFALRVPDIDQAQADLDTKGVTYKGPQTRPDGGLQIFVTDPDGYWVELCDLRNVGA